MGLCRVICPADSGRGAGRSARVTSRGSVRRTMLIWSIGVVNLEAHGTVARRHQQPQKGCGLAPVTLTRRCPP
jgi:hypothetical protein